MMPTLEMPGALPLETEASFQLLFHHHPLPMWVVDANSLAFIVVNDAAVRKYGYSREEFLSMTMDQMAEPDETAAKSDSQDGGGSTSWRHRRKDGGVLHVESTWHEISFGGRDAVLVLTLDRTEHRLAEKRSREQANLLNLASDAIMVRDLDHRVLFWNQGATHLYGWTAEEMVGAKMVDTFAKERNYDAEIALLKTGYWTGELKHQRKDGLQLIINSRWTLVRGDDGNPVSVLVIDTDVTETKKLESQFLRAQRLEGIGTLASGIAHDLNNILSPILMSCGILRKQLAGDDDTLKMLKIIEGSAERGAGIVKQVLTFARGVEGERVLLQLKHLVSELAKVMAQTFPRNVDIQTYFPAELWTVMGDATQLHQVLLNLCVNARDAMPNGGTITINAENVDIDEHFASMNPGAQLGAHVVLRASDTGSGMPPEVMEKIFDPFFTTKEVGKGTGLGLATVIGIIKSHGGFLTVQSEVGVGTTFSVFLPASRKTSGDDDQKVEEAVPIGKGELVLVVDDEPPIREALVHTLEANGYRCYTAEDGSDALALYFQRRKDIDLVLTDINMAQMDGVALVRSLRKVDPHVRCIVSSGHFQKENMVILEGLGVKTFLDKPYTADKMLRAVRATLDEPIKASSAASVS